MSHLSTRRFRDTATLLNECVLLTRRLQDGRPTTPLSSEEREAASRVAYLCTSLLLVLCDNKRARMGEAISSNELMARVFAEDPYCVTDLMERLWTPNGSDCERGKG
ncbi:hypothetical protein [Pseudomonas sp. CGJS7]|uniref:hypothetical protein n=1 Tax=Pseudomonas sp. CGJS7 TaxID=3109348 RepID=UPI003009434B